MAIKMSILVLGLLLIVPNMNAAPAASSSEEDMPKAALERLKLALLTFSEFIALFSELSVKGPNVFKAVLKDPNVIDNKSEEMQKYIHELTDYIEKSDKVKKEKEDDETFDMFQEYTEIVNKFDSERHTNLSPAALVVEKSLKENGLDELEKTVIQRFESFFNKFTAEVESYLSDLNSKEKTAEKELSEWYEKLKNEKDLDKKIEIFDNFIDSDENED